MEPVSVFHPCMAVWFAISPLSAHKRYDGKLSWKMGEKMESATALIVRTQDTSFNVFCQTLSFNHYLFHSRFTALHLTFVFAQ